MRSRMRMLMAAAMVAVGAIASACGSSADTASTSTSAPVQTGNVSVDIRNFAFAPPSLTLRVGSQVTWKNDDTATHTATAADGTFDAGNIAPGSSSTAITLSKAGTIQYRCNIHQYMTATIQVVA